MHFVVQRLDELKVGTHISFKGAGAIHTALWQEYEPGMDGEPSTDDGVSFEITAIEGESLTVATKVLDHPSRPHQIHFNDYISSDVFSPDNIAKSDEFSVCEAHYGIDHHGSEHPDERRKLAFAILRGEPEALDAAMEALAIIGGRQ